MFQFPLPSIDFQALGPAILVALTGLIALGIELFAPRRNNNLIVLASLLGLALALGALFLGLGQYSFGTTPTVLLDPLGNSLQAILLVSTALIILVSEPYLREKKIPFAEFYPLVLWSTAGGMLMVGTSHLLLMFLGLEILSIAIYVMAGMNRGEARSGESALKYFLLGSFASSFMLYGIALVYGASGSLSLGSVSMAWVHNDGVARPLLLVGLGMLLVGLSFKSSFAPFHQWTPDVYQGAPTNVTAFMATVSKVAALGALWRILDAYNLSFNLWAPAVGALAILTMVVGNVAALAQRDIKRIVGYSSVAQAGYVLVAILAHAKDSNVSPQTLVFFLLSYVLATIGILAVVMLSARGGTEATTLDDLSGLSRRSPLAAGALAFFALSLIGLPPLGGFFAKFYVLSDALRVGMPSLAIALALTSAVSVVYYLRIARAPFSSESEAGERAPVAPALRTALVVCGVGVLAIVLFSTPLFTALDIVNPTGRGVANAVAPSR